MSDGTSVIYTTKYITYHPEKSTRTGENLVAGHSDKIRQRFLVQVRRLGITQIKTYIQQKITKKEQYENQFENNKIGLLESLRRLLIDVQYDLEPVVNDRPFVIATDGSAKDRRCGGGAVLCNSNENFCYGQISIDCFDYMDYFREESGAMLEGVLLAQTT